MRKIYFISLKFNLILLLFLFSQNIALSQGRVDIKVQNVTLEDCLKIIKEQTKVGYLTKDESISDIKGISMSLKYVTIDSVLKTALKNTDYTFEIDNDVILIVKKKVETPPKKQVLAKTYDIKGNVLTLKDKSPLFFATVYVKNTTRYTNTDENGAFSFTVPSGEITLIVSILGYESVEKVINVKDNLDGITFYLREQSLSLNEVIVTAETTQSKSGSSTYKIGEQAIQQVQPVSVKDILQLLPGAKISTTNLTEVSQITLRNAAPENTVFSQTNSFGTSIIVDGVQLSNDANMQADNPNRSTSGGRNVVNRGIDLRQVSASTIESVEVVEGVANARYGNMTSGAVIIKRKAGETPWIVGVNALPASYQASFSKGFASTEIGSLNFNLDYAFANSSPIVKKNYYQRISGGIRWTTVLNKKRNWNNTVFYDFSTQLDGVRFEPEEIVHTNRKTNNRNHIISINGALDLKGRLSYNLNATYAYQYTYSEEHLSDGPLPTIESLLPGRYEGSFTALSYIKELEMIGAPLAIKANIEHEQNIVLKGQNLSMNYGLDFTFDKNYGSGRNIKGDAVNTSSGYPGTRAANFHDVPASVTYSSYFQSDLSKDFENFSYVLRAGLRYDYMLTRYNLLSPRLSATTKFFNKIRLRAAWGLSYKAPSMITLYPGPSYFDLVNLSWFTNNPLERLAVITTFVEEQDNTFLKPSEGETVEFGFDYENKGFNVNITAYRKDLRNGIATSPYLKIYQNEIMKVVERPQDKPPVYMLDSIADFPRILYKYNNNLSTRTDGFSFFINFPKIVPTNTRISASGAFNDTYTNNNSPFIGTSAFLVEGERTRYGVYSNVSYSYQQLRSNLTIVQHFPAIRLLLTLIVENSWINKKKAHGATIYPVAYYDMSGVFHEIPKENRDSDEYKNLFLTENTYDYYPEPSYSNFHLQVRKETTQGHSFSFYANNFLWHQPTYYDPIGLRPIRLNSDITFGFGVTFKF